MRSSQPHNCLHPLLSTDFLRLLVDSRTDISRDKITATVILPFFGLHAQYQLCHATVWSSAPLQNTLESVPATTTIQINTTKHSTTTTTKKRQASADATTRALASETAIVGDAKIKRNIRFPRLRCQSLSTAPRPLSLYLPSQQRPQVGLGSHLCQYWKERQYSVTASVARQPSNGFIMSRSR